MRSMLVSRLCRVDWWSCWVDERADAFIAEVDAAVGEAKQDGTGGRGTNGFISGALAEEHKKDEVMKSAV
jgi:hypothetical protein